MIRFWIRIAANLLLFPVLYPRKKAYPTLREHFSIGDDVPARADFAVALGCSLRADGTASSPTRAIASLAAKLQKEGRAGKVILSGGNPVNGVSEGEAMRRVLEREFSLAAPEVVMDGLPDSKYVGTLDQARSVGEILKKHGARTAVLVVQPQQLPRALWVFRREVPGIRFHPANPVEEYDPLSTQLRMRSRRRFRLWNMIAWAGLWRITDDIKKQ